jgi:hypothetical protein
MSIKFFRGASEVYKFDPESCKSFVFLGSSWKELNEPESIEEIRYRTVELSRAEAAQRFGAELDSGSPASGNPERDRPAHFSCGFYTCSGTS